MKDSLIFQYKGLEIYIASPDVKHILLRDYPKLCAKYELKSGRTLNQGEIIRKYAWDSICAKVEAKGKFKKVLEEIYKGSKE